MPGYAVERHEPDPRGWTVVNSQGKKVGEVKDLIVDTNRMTARYLDVELDTKLFDWRGEDPHVLVPVEHAHIDGKHLLVPDITQAWVADLRAQRNAHVHEFWDRWWLRVERRPGAAGLATRVSRVVQHEELQRVIDGVQPGESVRIPVVNEEIVVQRRPSDEHADHREIKA